MDLPQVKNLNNIQDQIQQIAAEFEKLLKPCFHDLGLSRQLQEAMAYGSLAAGKRFRPFLTYKIGQIFHVEPALCLKASIAIELIHCYSLIHDDLPSMDNDDLRRGKPTLHRKYDEATAILAGDALQSLAYEHLCSMDKDMPAEKLMALISTLAHAAGSQGMVGGQMLDMEAEEKHAHHISLKDIENIQRLKTGAIIEASCLFGAILGDADFEQKQAIHHWSRYLGEAFQITDDLLDHLGDAKMMGKEAQKDDAHGKMTFVTILGLKGAEQHLKNLRQKARIHLDQMGLDPDDQLDDLWAWLLHRKF